MVKEGETISEIEGVTSLHVKKGKEKYTIDLDFLKSKKPPMPVIAEANSIDLSSIKDISGLKDSVKIDFNGNVGCKIDKEKGLETLVCKKKGMKKKARIVLK